VSTSSSLLLFFIAVPTVKKIYNPIDSTDYMLVLSQMPKLPLTPGLIIMASIEVGIFAGAAIIHPSNLATFQGKGKYRLPEFIWYQPADPTAIKFLNSGMLGRQYQNDIFVEDFHHGNIYQFKLNQNRTGLLVRLQ
jgi:hypothetical protein